LINPTKLELDSLQNEPSRSSRQSLNRSSSSDHCSKKVLGSYSSVLVSHTCAPVQVSGLCPSRPSTLLNSCLLADIHGTEACGTIGVDPAQHQSADNWSHVDERRTGHYLRYCELSKEYSEKRAKCKAVPVCYSWAPFAKSGSDERIPVSVGQVGGFHRDGSLESMAMGQADRDLHRDLLSRKGKKRSTPFLMREPRCRWSFQARNTRSVLPRRLSGTYTLSLSTIQG